MRRVFSRLVMKLRRALALPRNYEEAVLRALVRQGDTILDVGAHVGSVAMYLARAVGPSGKVYAFEPIAPIFDILNMNLRHLRRSDAPVIPFQFGLSDVCTRTTLQVPNGRFGFASLASTTEWSAAVGCGGLESFACHLVTIDDFLKERPQLQVNFVKIDVEGAEKLVLKGAKRMLNSRSRPVLFVELFAPWERAFGYSPWDVLGLLKDCGYEILFVCPKGVVEHAPTAAHPFPPEYEEGYNIIAYVPELHGDRIRSLNPLRYDPARKPFEMEAPPMPNRIAVSVCH